MKYLCTFLLACFPLPTTSFVPNKHTSCQGLHSRHKGWNTFSVIAQPSVKPNQSLQQTNNDNDNSDEIFFFNDFDHVIGDGDSAGNSHGQTNALDHSGLQERIRVAQQEEIQRETKLLRNWKKGDWSVRGFSLDPVDALLEASDTNSINMEDDVQQQPPTTTATTTNSASQIQVSQVAADVNSQGSRIWVGRSNGVLLWVQLGKEYLAHFHSKISGTITSNNSDADQDVDDDAPSSTAVRFNSELVRESSQQKPNVRQGISPNAGMSSPFQILAQCSPSNQPASAISNILPVPDEDFVFTTCVGSGQIHQWHLGEDDIGRKTPALSSPIPLSDEIHKHEIAALKLIYYQDSPLLFSVGIDGSLAIWDVYKGDLIYNCNIGMEHLGDVEDSGNNNNNYYGGLDTRIIHCADVTDNQIFLGTATGYVLGYGVADILDSASSGGTCPMPRGKFKAHDKGVTAVACGGPGSLGRGGGKGTSSTVLLTGGACGLVKQWYVSCAGIYSVNLIHDSILICCIVHYVHYD